MFIENINEFLFLKSISRDKEIKVLNNYSNRSEDHCRYY